MRRTLSVLVCLTVLLGGCKAKEALDAAGISKDLEKKGTTDLMKEVADDTYEAPEDGKLTDAQMQMYLKVREEEKKIARVAKEEAKQHADKAKASGEKSIAGMMEGFKTLAEGEEVEFEVKQTDKGLQAANVSRLVVAAS